MRILDVYDGQKVTELGTRALEEVWVSRPCLCFCVLDRSVNKRERETEQPAHQRTQNQQQVTAEPVESPLPGRTGDLAATQAGGLWWGLVRVLQ